MKPRDFDVVVVGAGIAGGMVAYRLATAGARVLMIEAGGRNPPRFQMVGMYATAANKTLHSPYVEAESDLKAPSPDGPNDYYDQPQAGPGQAYKSTYERRTGGSTWHWLGHTPRMLRSDFQMQSRYGGRQDFPAGLVDWPTSYDDLEPWYCEAEREMGVAGSDEEWQGLFDSPRSKPFPMSMIWPSYSDTWIAERINGKKFEGIEYRVRSTPSARNSELYDGRPPCAGNSICVPLCPIGAKYDGSVHVAKAIAAGASLWERCVVSKLDKDKDDLVHTVEFLSYGGGKGSVTADIVVLTAHAIETPKLLLMSGLANKSDQVGRNLMDHLSKSTFGVAPEKLFPFRGPPSTSGIESFRDGEFRRQRAGFRVSLNNDGWSRKGSPSAEIIDLVTNQKLIGTDLQTALFERITRQVRLSCSVEVAPDASNRVVLSDKTDALGLPRPKLTFTPPDYSLRGLAQATKTLGDMFRLINATEVALGEPTAYDGAGHIMGTCRMGSSPNSSVVDSHCRSHDHRNLFIVGSSVFPTVGSPNPTLTLAALALRTAEEIGKQLGIKAKPHVQA
ncbi:MAG TPA: GMC family oxidoreductase [Verrucomicrobiae bacterium]|nr:GMC family oxidoreductase [Verrucomicrobiae bacterium]